MLHLLAVTTFSRLKTVSAAILAACISTTQAVEQLSRDNVEQIVAQACTEASRINRDAIIAVTDREGFLLALWDVKKRLPKPLPGLQSLDPATLKLYGLVAGAVTKASTAAFLSSNQNAFTSRTAGYIIQQHFPPGVRNTAPGPLVGVGFSSLFFTDVNRVKLVPDGFRGDFSVKQLVDFGFITLGGTAPSFGDLSPGVRTPQFPLTSLNDSPGGVPLYKNGDLVGGIGVVGDGDPTDLTPAAALLFGATQRFSTPGFKVDEDPDEFVALAGQTGFRPPNEIVASNVLINGIRIPYVHPRIEDIRDVDDVPPLGTIGQSIDVPIAFQAPTAVPPSAVLVPNQALYTLPDSPTLNVGDRIVEGTPKASPNEYPYEIDTLGGFQGEIRFPFRDDPLLHDANLKNDRIGKAKRLTKEEVKDIISRAADRCRTTRAGIRLPLGTSAKVFISVVSNPSKPGQLPQILGVFRTGEATIFSWDVAVQKARTAVMFSNTQLAMSSRTVGFLAQRFFPPGIDGTPHGPYFGFQEAVTLKLRPAADIAAGNFPFPGNPNTPNGITIFPGGFPLYKDGFLVGAIGISGDGVDQDDLIGISGTKNFRPKFEIRADNYTYRGARLPYVKFPRDPEK